MGVLTSEAGWKEVGYTTEPTTLQTWVDYDPATKKYITRIGTKPSGTYDRGRYYRPPIKHSDDLAEWERELLYGDVPSGCQCSLCRDRRGEGGPAVNPDNNSAEVEELKRELQRVKDELADAIRQRDEYDAEASTLAKELERAMTARDELLDVLSWYEQTE